MDRTALYIYADDEMDLGDIVHIARSEGKKAFNTDENIKVLKCFNHDSNFVVVVEPESSSNPQSLGKKGEKTSVKT